MRAALFPLCGLTLADVEKVAQEASSKREAATVRKGRASWVARRGYCW